MKTPLRRVLVAVLAATAPVLATVACTESSTAADAVESLTVGFVVDPSWAQIPVAADAGLFDNHGVEVEVVNFSSGVEAVQAVAAGQVDVATAADVPVSAALTRSPSLRVVGDGSRWEGSRIVALRSAGVNTIEDLAGKSIGTPFGTSAAHFVASALEDNGVDAELVQVAPSAMVTAATQQDVDAVSIFQPYQAQVIAALGDDAVELTGGSYRQHSLYLATQEAVEQKSAALTSFFAAISEAGTQLTEGSESAVDAVSTATQLDAELLRGVLPQFDYTLQLQPELASELTALAEWAKTQGSIEPTTELPDYAAHLDSQFLP